MGKPMVELRNEVVYAVQGIDNELLLQQILELILRGSSIEPYVLTDEQSARIEAARENYRLGQVKSHRTAMDETRKWLLSK
jgi:hypothetical protein